MQAGRFVYAAAAALVLLAVSPSIARAQDDHQLMALHDMHHDGSRNNALVKAVRDATRRFQDPAQAIAEGYLPTFGCVTDTSAGVMGVHFINMSLVMDPQLDIAHPEIVVYEPLGGGRYRLVAADYLVDQATWDAANPGPPELLGQLFHLFPAPNRFRLNAFYTLHVWAWQDNPRGTFANWNPTVSCDAYSGQ